MSWMCITKLWIRVLKTSSDWETKSTDSTVFNAWISWFLWNAVQPAVGTNQPLQNKKKHLHVKRAISYCCWIIYCTHIWNWPLQAVIRSRCKTTNQSTLETQKNTPAHLVVHKTHRECAVRVNVVISLWSFLSQMKTNQNITVWCKVCINFWNFFSIFICSEWDIRTTNTLCWIQGRTNTQVDIKLLSQCGSCSFISPDELMWQ